MQEFFFFTLADLVLIFCLFFYCKRLCRKFFSQIFHHPHPPQKSNGSAPLTVNALISPPGSLLNFGQTGGEEGLIRQGDLLEKGGAYLKIFDRQRLNSAMSVELKCYAEAVLTAQLGPTLPYS